MRITKYQHAALVVESDSHRVVIDPGSFTEPMPDLPNLAAIIVTHEHRDHWTPEHLDHLIEAANDVPMYSTTGVMEAAAGYGIRLARPGETAFAPPFTFRFFGGEHAVVHHTLPSVENVGVLVNDTFYYPGDSFAAPAARGVALLAVPAGGPWMKIGEAMDFILEVAPRRVVATHDGNLALSEREGALACLRSATQRIGGEFYGLGVGESVDI